MAKYAEFFSRHDEAMRFGADEATRAGLAKMAELMPYVLGPVVITCGMLLAFGLMDRQLFFRYSSRVVIMMWLIVGGAFMPYVRDIAVDVAPNEFASALHAGTNTRITAVQQFDRVDDAAGFFTARVLSQATGLFQVGNHIAAWQARGWQKTWLEAIFYIWVAMRLLTYFAVAILAFMLIFIPFQTTIGWFMGQLNSVVGLVMWQLSASILLKIMLGGMEIYLRGVIQRGIAMSIEQQVDQCWEISGWFFGCFIMIIMIPAVIGVKTASAGGSLIASGAMVNAATNLTRIGNNIARAGRGGKK